MSLVACCWFGCLLLTFEICCVLGFGCLGLSVHVCCYCGLFVWSGFVVVLWFCVDVCGGFIIGGCLI